MDTKKKAVTFTPRLILEQCPDCKDMVSIFNPDFGPLGILDIECPRCSEDVSKYEDALRYHARKNLIDLRATPTLIVRPRGKLVNYVFEVVRSEVAYSYSLGEARAEKHKWVMRAVENLKIRAVVDSAGVSNVDLKPLVEEMTSLKKELYELVILGITDYTRQRTVAQVAWDILMEEEYPILREMYSARHDRFTPIQSAARQLGTLLASMTFHKGTASCGYGIQRAPARFLEFLSEVKIGDVNGRRK